jgi:predicted acylesterase/phospholipase RssA
MPQSNSENVRFAREIESGSRSLTLRELVKLADSLKEENEIGHARRVYQVAQSLAPNELRDQIQIKLALTTYKDPGLPVDERLKKAESMLLELLLRAATLPVSQLQETLGVIGGVYKTRWSVYGHKDHLEKAAFYYRSGYDLGIANDFGYTALNTAFVLDLLADADRGMSTEPSDAAKTRTAESARIRSEIIATLPGLVQIQVSLESQWWFDCTLGEAYLGLRQFDQARVWVRKGAAQRPDNWRLESTARQMAHIVRMQCKADQLSLEQWSEAPGFAVLSDLLGGSAAAAMSFFLGKVGLALSGGGFRASLFHIGVLARLAELDMLRHVEVISSVSGGSILAAYYYMEVRRLFETKPDAAITQDDYIQIVRNVEAGFLEGVQRNIRLRMFLEPGSNWKVLSSVASTTTDRLADLYERELYARVRDGHPEGRDRYLQELLVHPAGTPDGVAFAPRYDNWRRLNKAPILILNSTTLNTCHNWQFTATYMGEPPLRAIDIKIDSNNRLRRLYYDEAPSSYRKVRLGLAVAASACVPGLFDPLVLAPLYPGFAAKLVDGGVYDNQGVASLLGEDCTVLLISDASGQTAVEKEPGGERIGVAMRSNNVLMARSRQVEYQLLSALTDAGLLRGVAYVHLKKDLDSQPVDWVDCPDPSTPEQPAILTTYGIRKDVQQALASIRTDLDGFSDAEADALMLSGYHMMREEFAACIRGFPVTSSTAAPWRFREIEKLASAVTGSPELVELKKTLAIAHATAFKPYRLSTAIKLITWILGLTAAAGIIWAAISIRDQPIRLSQLLLFLVGLVLAGVALNRFLRLVRNPNPLWQVLLAIPLLILGWPLTWIWTTFFDPVYLRSGPRYRK